MPSFAENTITLCSDIFPISSAVTICGRSDLLSRITACFPSEEARISRSSLSRGTDPSIMTSRRSASAAAFRAFSTPICSTRSVLSRIPAVSVRFRLSPAMRMCSVSVSLVVPAISVTMARSSPARRFRREDFPAFGFPRITVEIPSFMTFPLSAFSIRFSSLRTRIPSFFPSSSG